MFAHSTSYSGTTSKTQDYEVKAWGAYLIGMCLRILSLESKLLQPEPSSVSLSSLKSTVDEAWLSQLFLLEANPSHRVSPPLHFCWFNNAFSLLISFSFKEEMMTASLRGIFAIVEGGGEVRQEMIHNISSGFISKLDESEKGMRPK